MVYEESNKCPTLVSSIVGITDPTKQQQQATSNKQQPMPTVDIELANNPKNSPRDRFQNYRKSHILRWSLQVYIRIVVAKQLTFTEVYLLLLLKGTRVFFIFKISVKETVTQI
jgi:fatty-acid desaturase